MQPAASAAELFERLRLRKPMAEAFAAAGLIPEEHWQAAARVRAAFAHAAWIEIEIEIETETETETTTSAATEAPETALPSLAPFDWLQDPDVSWLIGVHEYEGVGYLVKESFERLLWWMSLRRLLELAETLPPDPAAVASLEQRLESAFRAARESGYRVDTLLASLN